MDQRVRAALDSYSKRLEIEDEFRRTGQRLDAQESLFAIGPETGQFINLLVRSLKAPRILEIGTAFGYSTIWLAEAARASEGIVVTLELESHKSAYARRMAEEAGLAESVDFRVGDAVTLIPELDGSFDFVLLDLWKELYPACLEVFHSKLKDGAIIVADNMLSPRHPELRLYSERLRQIPGMTSVLLPIGSGLEVSRWLQ